MTQKLSFEVEKINLIERSDEQLAIAEIWVCHDQNNLHNMPISLGSIKRAAPTLLNKFVVAEFKNGDFTTHTPYEQIIGFFPKENNIRYVEKNGKTYLVADAIISKIYADWAITVFENENERPVSMEIEVVDSGKDDLGRDEIREFIFLGVTILSKKTQEACVGSKVSITKFSTKDIDNAQKFYQKFFEKYGAIDFSIPDNVKLNAQRGIELHKQHGGGTSVSLAHARFTLKSAKITPEKVRHAFKYFESHKDRELDEKTPNRDFISWMLYGGNEAYRWSKDVVEMMNDVDAKKLSFFTSSGDTDDSKKKEVNNFMEDENKEKEQEVKKEENKDPEKKEEMAAETPEQENKEDKKEEENETPEQENKEQEGKKEEMSNDAYLDVAAALAFLQSETEKNQEWVDEEQTAMFAEMEKGKDGDHAMMAKGLFSRYQKMCNKMAEMSAKFAEMEETCKKMAAENEDLKKFKADVETQQKQFAIDTTMKDVEDVMPKGEMDVLREQAVNFSLENIDAWKNLVRAKAFEFSKGKGKGDGIVRIGMPFTNNNGKKSSIWD